MTYACQYAIVRFLPYVETGEFANVGVVMYCVQSGLFQYKLLDRVRRITAFFEELDVGVYRRARTEFATELSRISHIFNDKYVTGNPSAAKALFAELTRPREAMLRFDKVRVVMAEDPVEQFQKLFDHYIGRNFATKAYQEQLIEKQVRQALRAADLSVQYKEKVLGNHAYHARFPFVRMEGDKATSAIKPLHLGQDDPTQIFDHGWEWVGKLRKLRSEDLLPPAVLFAIQGPGEQSKERAQAFQEIVQELGKQQVQIIDHERTADIVQFARQQSVNRIAV
jgi:hypothetical protein